MSSAIRSRASRRSVSSCSRPGRACRRRRRAARGASTCRACAAGCTRAARARPGACPRRCGRGREDVEDHRACGRRRACSSASSSAALLVRRELVLADDDLGASAPRSAPAARRPCPSRCRCFASGRCGAARPRRRPRRAPCAAARASRRAPPGSASGRQHGDEHGALGLRRDRGLSVRIGRHDLGVERGDPLHGLGEPIVGHGQREAHVPLAELAVGEPAPDDHAALGQQALRERLRARRRAASVPTRRCPPRGGSTVTPCAASAAQTRSRRRR